MLQIKEEQLRRDRILDLTRIDALRMPEPRPVATIQDVSMLIHFFVMKSIEWLGSSRADVRAFPEDARIDVGWQLELIQRGQDPDDWKPLSAVGQGVREIRVREAVGTFRVIYLAVFDDRVLVLHAFQKKTQATAKRDLDLAKQRLNRWRAQQ